MTQAENVEMLRCGIVAVVGRTNSGKSTLFNRILGEKVSIVSPVVQTTRNVIRGILTDSRGQLVLVDTPGLHKAQGHLGTRLNKMARVPPRAPMPFCLLWMPRNICILKMRVG